jgi:hypothetical protein
LRVAAIPRCAKRALASLHPARTREGRFENCGTRIRTRKETPMQTTEQLIERAKETEGGHLTIGRGGFTLHFDDGCTLSGYDIDRIKALCIAAGLPVIDSLCVAFDTVAELAISGPMVAVGSAPKFFLSRAFSYVALDEWVAAYRAAGAEIYNMPEVSHEPAS